MDDTDAACTIVPHTGTVADAPYDAPRPNGTLEDDVGVTRGNGITGWDKRIYVAALASYVPLRRRYR